MKTFKEYINENKHQAFSIEDANGNELFITKADNGADIIDRKLKQAKYKKLKDLVIIRYAPKREEVTKLFIE